MSTTDTSFGAMFKLDHSNYYMTAFLALIMAIKEAILGTVSLKSQVMTAGGCTRRVSKPLSTSLMTSISPLQTEIRKALVACGQFNTPASNCPVWLLSSSTAV